MDNVKKPRRPHPLQPIIRATDGVVRFQKNAVVEWLLCEASLGRVVNLNEITKSWRGFSREDLCQFMQLIGYSVSGFVDLGYATRAQIKMADLAASRIPSRKRERP